MTENELKLINMIREHDDPAQALVTAIEIIVLHQNHRGLFELKSSVEAREFLETSQA